MRKIIPCAIAAVMATSITTGAVAVSSAFSDLPETHWAYEFVTEAAEKGWVSGVGGGLFAPDNEVTYADLTTMLVRAFFSEQLEAQTVADDTPWYAAACSAAEEIGLYVGVDIRTQHANESMVTQPVSRYEMAQILYNAVRAAGVQLTPDLSAAQESTADWDSVPGRYQAAVAATKGAGILAGVDSVGTFNGTATMTRAQAATVMSRLDDALDAGSTIPALFDGNTSSIRWDSSSVESAPSDENT